MAFGTAKLTQASFNAMSSNRIGLEAMQLAESRAKLLRTGKYADLAAQAKTQVNNTSFYDEVVLGNVSTDSSGISSRTATVNVYHGADTLPRIKLPVTFYSNGRSEFVYNDSDTGDYKRLGLKWSGSQWVANVDNGTNEQFIFTDKVISSNVDLNSIVTTGAYSVKSSCANQPETGIWGQLYVDGNTGYITQRYIPEYPAENTRIYIRRKNGTVWTSWSQMNGIPSGTICIWHGTASNVPSGWAICNGSNGTPDLRSRFVYGANDSDNNTKSSWGTGWNNIVGHWPAGWTGGSEREVMSIAEMPSHQHNFWTASWKPTGNDAYSITAAAGDRSLENSNGQRTNTVLTTNSGNNESHNLLPPFMTLCYIMKL